ncbi:MAG: transposase [Trichodesmium sp. MO_231.B1]|nr:transposase [Trichodesmium sp. MO_231.B1]
MSKLSEQGGKVCSYLEHRAIVVVDSQYGCASFVKQTADIPCDQLMRLSSNRCFYGEPMITHGRGRPRLHGDKFKLNEPQTWRGQDQKLEVEHPKLGKLQIIAWHKLHFRPLIPGKIIIEHELSN